MGMSVIIDGSAGVTTNAGGSVNPSTTIDGINYSCRAWVNFNGTGTVAIRASGNVTSITDNGTGDYTVNFTTAMADANYAVTANMSPIYGTGYSSAVQLFVQTSGVAEVAPTTAAFRILCVNLSGTAFHDPKYINISIFR
jgi:hypothetical protein